MRGAEAGGSEGSAESDGVCEEGMEVDSEGSVLEESWGNLAWEDAEPDSVGGDGRFFRRLMASV